jgi:hormone-sensitive lipase
MDPFLDDCVMFAKKLKKLGVVVSLDILDGLPHGFLNFIQVGGYCSETHILRLTILCVKLLGKCLQEKG